MPSTIPEKTLTDKVLRFLNPMHDVDWVKKTPKLPEGMSKFGKDTATFWYIYGSMAKGLFRGYALGGLLYAGATAVAQIAGADESSMAMIKENFSYITFTPALVDGAQVSFRIFYHSLRKDLRKNKGK